MNEQEQIVNLVIDQLIAKPELTIQQLMELGLKKPEIVLGITASIVQKAEAGDEKAAAAKDILEQASGAQEAAEEVAVARLGAKLNYIKLLRGSSTDGYKTVYFKAGGKVYSQHVKEEPQKMCKGTRLSKGGSCKSTPVSEFRKCRKGCKK